MKQHEVAIREILAQAQYLLRKDDEQFRLNPVYNAPRCRYEVHVLMGRKEFEEVYVFRNDLLDQAWYCRAFHDKWYDQIKLNLKLNEGMYK